MARAASSLPVPLSPHKITVESFDATLEIIEKTCRIAMLSPRIFFPGATVEGITFRRTSVGEVLNPCNTLALFPANMSPPVTVHDNLKVLTSISQLQNESQPRT